MSRLRRIVMVRHGETVGESSVRFHGATDVPLSDEGRRQMRDAAAALRQEVFDLVVASTLSRSWEGASIVSGGAPVRLEPAFCEIDFGRWEGLTIEEIEASDPVIYAEWQAREASFEFPGGEARDAFRARVLGGFERVEASGAQQALLVVHRGIVRTIAERLLGEATAGDDPAFELGGCFDLSRAGDGSWARGRRGSDPVFE